MPAAAVPDERDLRSRSALELADVAVAVVRRSYPVQAAAALAFTVPTGVALWAAAAVGTGRVVAGGVAVQVVGLVLAHAACVDAAGADWFGGRPDARRAITSTLRRSPALLALWIGGTFRVAVGTVLLVVPGVLAALELVPAVPALVFERAGPAGALRRARALSRQRRGAHLGALVATVALVAALVLVLVQPVVVAAVVGSGRDAPLHVGIAAGQLAAAALVVPLFAAVSTAAYVDARVRKEGLDLLYLLAAPTGGGSEVAA